MGETGSGKSVTSLSVLMLVPPPGRIEDGDNYLETSKDEKDVLLMDDSSLRNMRGKDISMIFQEPRAYLNPVYTVEDPIGEVMLVHRKPEFLKSALDSLEKMKKSSAEASNCRRMIRSPKSLSTRFMQRFGSKKKVKSEVRKEVVKVLRA